LAYLFVQKQLGTYPFTTFGIYVWPKLTNPLQ